MRLKFLVQAGGFKGMFVGNANNSTNSVSKALGIFILFSDIGWWWRARKKKKKVELMGVLFVCIILYCMCVCICERGLFAYCVPKWCCVFLHFFIFSSPSSRQKAFMANFLDLLPYYWGSGKVVVETIVSEIEYYYPVGASALI